MTKKQILATCLAGTLALGVLGGCANKKTERNISSAESAEIENSYIVSTAIASAVTKEDGTVEYVGPNPSYTVIDGIAYQVSYRTVIEPKEYIDENGKVSYYIPNGGIISYDGNQVIGYQDIIITDPEIIDEVLASYLGETNKLALR